MTQFIVGNSIKALDKSHVLVNHMYLSAIIQSHAYGWYQLGFKRALLTVRLYSTSLGLVCSRTTSLLTTIEFFLSCSKTLFRDWRKWWSHYCNLNSLSGIWSGPLDSCGTMLESSCLNPSAKVLKFRGEMYKVGNSGNR